jgi:hypothetical protein
MRSRGSAQGPHRRLLAVVERQEADQQLAQHRISASTSFSKAKVGDADLARCG